MSAPVGRRGPDHRDHDSRGRHGRRPCKQYRALRRMHARSEKFNHEGWMELDRARRRTSAIEIVSERGSDNGSQQGPEGASRAREGADRQRRLRAFRADGRKLRVRGRNHRTRRAGTSPSSRSVRTSLLVDGRMVLSEDGRELLRVEGVLLEEPVVLDEPGERDPALRQARRRPGADRDRVDREGEVRRGVRSCRSTTSTSRSTAGRSASRHGSSPRTTPSAASPERAQRVEGPAEQRRVRRAVSIRDNRYRARFCAIRFAASSDGRFATSTRQRSAEQPFEFRAVFCRLRDAGRQRHIGERRLPLQTAATALVEMLARADWRSAEHRRQPFERDHRFVDRSRIPSADPAPGHVRAPRARSRISPTRIAGSVSDQRQRASP